MAKQLSFDSQARESLRRGVDQVANAVKVTLGPRGRSVVLDRRYGAPTITNDGMTIAREIDLADPYENLGAQLIKEVSAKTQEVAGDGATTATILAQAIVHEGLRVVAGGANPMAVKRGIERAVAAVVEDLHRQSMAVSTPAEIEQVAAISANNDPVIGELVSRAMDAVGREGVVTVEEARGLDTHLDVLPGMQLDRGYLSPYFVTDAERMEAVLEDSLILVHDRRIASFESLVPLLEQVAGVGRPLLIVADEVEGEALSALVVNRLRGSLVAAAVRAPAFGDLRLAILEDLAVLTGGQLVSDTIGCSLDAVRLADLGSARRVTVGRESTTIVGGGGAPDAVRERVSQLRGQIERAVSEHDRDQLRGRLARLAGGVAVIRVGAATEVALKEKKARVEDALAATRAAVEEGVVPGGGVALLRALGALKELEAGLAAGGDQAAGVAIIERCLREPTRRLASNAGVNGSIVVEQVLAASGSTGWNADSLTIEDLRAAGVIDPTKVVRVALQHAASIGGLVLTTEALVAESPAPGEGEEEKEEE